MTCPYCKGPTAPIHAKSRFHRCAWCAKDMPDYMLTPNFGQEIDETQPVKPKTFLEKIFG